jgi:hypothetical protein
MADGAARSYSYPLDFLPADKTYRASIYTDTPGTQQTTHVVQTVTRATIVPIAMQPNGGHLMILEPAGR